MERVIVDHIMHHVRELENLEPEESLARQVVFFLLGYESLVLGLAVLHDNRSRADVLMLQLAQGWYPAGVDATGLLNMAVAMCFPGCVCADVSPQQMQAAVQEGLNTRTTRVPFATEFMPEAQREADADAEPDPASSN